MKTKIAALFCLSLLFLAALPTGAAEEQYAGSVVDDKGRPVAGATVDCYQYQSSFRFGYRDRQPELQQTTATDNKGAFAVSASQNTILVVVKKSGLATAWKTWDSAIPDSSEPIVLTAPAALSGVVMDDNGQPVADAEVWVAGANIGNEYDSASQMNELFGQTARACFSAKTSADGRFRIENFPADGRAGLAVSKAAMARHPIGSEFGGERDCQPGEDIKLVVGPAGNVEGKVIVAETGQPLGGVKIKLDSAGPGVFDSSYSEAVESGADGTFRVPDVQPGKHFIRASISGGPIPDWVLVPEDSQVNVVAGETVRDVVVHFSKGALMEVTVVVTNELTPIANVVVSVGESTAFTDTNGTALLRVPTGEGWFFASKEDWRPQQNKTEVVAGITNQVQIELTPPRKITGTVRDPSGAPVAGVLVSFHPGFYPSAPKYVETKTDGSGRYEMTMKEESREFMNWDGVIIETNVIMARSLERNLVTIQEFVEIPTNLDLTLQPGIKLSGSAKDTEGAPVTNATLDFSMVMASHFIAANPSSTNVNGQGAFAISAIPQGRDCFLRIAAKGYGAAGAMLKAGDSKTNHYEFPAFVVKRADRKLAGQILSRDGKPVVGATVNIWGQGQPAERNTKSDGEGHFSFNGVCAGEIKVSANYNRNQDQGDAPAQGGDTNIVVRLGIHSYDSGKYLSPPLKITGTVRDPSGTPLAGVMLSLFPVQALTVTGQSDSDGRYELNWQARLNQEETEWLLARDLNHGFATVHQVEWTMTNLDLTLQEGITLSTQVSDTDGRPLTNATATVFLRQGDRGFGVFEASPQPTTVDNSGHLRIMGLPQGQKYDLSIAAPGHTTAPLHVEADDTKTSLLELPSVLLRPTDGEVSGQVLDAEGKPAAGIEVQMFSAGMSTPRTTTDANGHFEYHGVRRGSLSFMAGLPIANSSALSNTGYAQGKSGDTNVVIRLGTGHGPHYSDVRVTTSGTVFDPSGAPDSGAVVDVLSTDGMYSQSRSDANGKYSLQWHTLLVRTNKAVLFVRDPAHNLAATAEWNTSTTSLDIHLQPGLTLSGGVRDSDGRQVTNAVVQLVPFPPADPAWGMNRQPPTNASPEGLYFFSALPQGAPYRVNVSAAGYGPGNVTASAADTQTRQFRLPTVVLNFANQQVAGQVIGLDGKPCWGAEVTVSGDGQPAGHISHSDANGHFVITEICPGSLNVRAMLPTSASNPRYLVETIQTHGGDTNVVVKLVAR